MDELIDGDEGIMGFKLPLNSYNHQISSGEGHRKLHSNNILRLSHGVRLQQPNEDEEGCENCKEEDEERKDEE